MVVHIYKRGVIHIEPKPGFDLYQKIIDSSPPSPVNLIRRGISDEETYFKGEPVEATLTFERNRRKVADSLKKIVSFLWERYRLPREGIAEYGSGSTGFFDAVLRPPHVPHWLQVEINTNAIAENMRRNPDAIIEEGSYKRIGKGDLSMILGLSSWDTTGDLPQALQQVAKALKPGGYFLHIQDFASWTKLRL